MLQKLRNATLPNIYECKICGEHHCEHDFPEDQSVQEMSPIIPIVRPQNIVLQSPPLGNKVGLGNKVNAANHVSSNTNPNQNSQNETQNE